MLLLVLSFPTSQLAFSLFQSVFGVETQLKGPSLSFGKVCSSFPATAARELTPSLVDLDSSPRGYPMLAAYVDSDTNFNIFRRFGYLRNRVMLHAQAELTQLERQLERLDKADQKSNEQALRSVQRDDSRNEPKRKKLLEEIETKLKAYGMFSNLLLSTPCLQTPSSLIIVDAKLISLDDLLFRSEKTLMMRRPTERNNLSYWNQLYNTQALVKSESDFILHKRDLVTLAGNQEDSWLNGFVEDALVAISQKGTQVCNLTLAAAVRSC